MMQLGMIGLGRMGANMVRRLLRGGHECVVFDMSPKAVEELVQEKAVGAADLKEFAKKLAAPRAVWLMVPAKPLAGQTRPSRALCHISNPGIRSSMAAIRTTSTISAVRRSWRPREFIRSEEHTSELQ